MFDPQTDALLSMREGVAELTAARAKIAAATAAFSKESSRLESEAGRRYSLVRVIEKAAAAQVGLIDGIEREVSAEIARRVGLYHDPHHVFVPNWAFRTVMQTGTGSMGGYTVGTDATNTIDPLYANSTCVRLGAQVRQVSQVSMMGDLTHPTIATKPSAQWIAEAGTATASDPLFGQVNVGLRTVIAASSMTKQLLLQSANPDYLGRVFGLAVGAAIDAAMLHGTGGAEPTGILRSTVGTTITGTSFTHANAQGLLRVAAAANAIDENIRWLSTPAIRETLSQRATGTGNEARYIWQGGNIADKPAFVSSNVLSGGILCGDFSTLFLLDWAGGIKLSFDPYSGTNFMSDIIGVKATAYVDLVNTQPAAWACGTGVT